MKGVGRRKIFFIETRYRNVPVLAFNGGLTVIFDKSKHLRIVL